VRSCLIDSGPLIALFAVDDHHHARFNTIVKELSAGGLRLITTWPCIVEASYVLEIPQRFEMLKWIDLGGAVVYPIEPGHLGDVARWMRRCPISSISSEAAGLSSCLRCGLPCSDFQGVPAVVGDDYRRRITQWNYSA
jgi:predicted nucleic acid-binding protein